MVRSTCTLPFDTTRRVSGTYEGPAVHVGVGLCSPSELAGALVE
jgi:hypothetical protein